MISLMAGMELAMLGQLVAPAKAETIMIPFRRLLRWFTCSGDG